VIGYFWYVYGVTSSHVVIMSRDELRNCLINCHLVTH